MIDLKGKIALITGASGSIGGEIAKTLHHQGATVVLSGTREAPLKALQEELGERAVVMTCSLSDAQKTAEFIPDVEAKVGPLDILINNAGLTRDGLIMRMKDEDWETVLDVNLTAVFRLTRAAIKSMMKRKSGTVINISSIVGVTGNPGQTNYAATKAGLIGFSKSLAQEVASRGITVNCVAPGFIKSPMTDILNDTQRSQILGRIPMGRIGDPSDIASACAFLASTGAKYITGQTIHVNGGMAMV